MADCVSCGCTHHTEACEVVHSPAGTECACPVCKCSDCTA